MKEGRYTFSHDSGDAARYAGELLLYFLEKRGVAITGKVIRSSPKDGDRLVYTYYSEYALSEVLMKMLEFSNNFIANQLVIAMGAEKGNQPGTLDKGVRVLREYTGSVLGLSDINIVEGSGISRKNRLSALDMLAVLKSFKPYRHLLKKEGPFSFKTGSLRGIRTRAGFYERDGGPPYHFAIFINRKGPNTNSLMKCVEHVVKKSEETSH